MTHPFLKHRAMWTIALTICLSTFGCGTSETDDTDANKSTAGSQSEGDDQSEDTQDEPSGAANTDEGKVRKTHADMIAALDEGDIKQFLIYYAPVEDYQRMKDRMDEVAQAMAAEPELADELKSKLTIPGNAVIVFNESKTEAYIRAPEGAKPPEPAAASTPSMELTDAEVPMGYGDDPAKVCEQALADLNAGNIEKFIQHVYPESELARSGNNLGLQIARISADETLVAAMKSDLETMQQMTPVMSEGDTVATYEMKREPFVQGRIKIEIPPKLVKLQKVHDNWRFYDHISGAVAEVKRQSSLAPVPAPKSEPAGLGFERIGDQWRLIRMPPR